MEAFEILKALRYKENDQLGFSDVVQVKNGLETVFINDITKQYRVIRELIRFRVYNMSAILWLLEKLNYEKVDEINEKFVIVYNGNTELQISVTNKYYKVIK